MRRSESRRTLGHAGPAARASLLALGLLAGVTGAACRQDMHDQPKVEVYEASDFFEDGRASRVPPEGTISRGALLEEELLYTGRVGGQFADVFPYRMTKELLQRGREQYDIYCAPCHGLTGMGNGMVVQRGFRPPPTFHSDRLRQQPAGYLYDVITNGFGAMPDYRTQVPPLDRWTIVAYVRALQYSQAAPLADVPAERRPELDGRPAIAPAPAAGHGAGH